MELLSLHGSMLGLSEFLLVQLPCGMESKPSVVGFQLFGHNLDNLIRQCPSTVSPLVFLVSELTKSSGFLRNSAWTVHDITTTGVDASVTFIIHSTPETLLLWPHPFRATYTVVISEQGLSCNFKSFNTGDTEFKCHALLHTYFSIPNIQEVAFNGYQGLSFADKTRENGTFQHSQEVPFEITQEVDRVYSPSCSDIPIPDITILHQPTDAPLMTIQKSAQIESQFSSFQTLPCDCVLWNPWVDKARALTDMDDEGYLSFVCVEPGVVSDYVTIPPGHALSLSQVLIPGGV
jgi:glucose-6-phosphate 1-epimerase